MEREKLNRVVPPVCERVQKASHQENLKEEARSQGNVGKKKIALAANSGVEGVHWYEERSEKNVK